MLQFKNTLEFKKATLKVKGIVEKEHFEFMQLDFDTRYESFISICCDEVVDMAKYYITEDDLNMELEFDENPEQNALTYVQIELQDTLYPIMEEHYQKMTKIHLQAVEHNLKNPKSKDRKKGLNDDQ